MDATAESLARIREPHGEVVLRRRDGVVELIVDGRFAMDTADTSTEELLARVALDAVDGSGLCVLVGGLGLGFTLAAVLADERVAEVVVVECSEAIIGWVRAGLVPQTVGVLEDPRVRVVVADVREHLATLPAARYDALLLDVDNGPEFLIHEGNGTLYQEAGLAAGAAALRPGGVLAVWSAGRSPALAAALAAEFKAPVTETLARVRRGRRDLEYAIYTIGTTSGPPQSGTMAR